MNTYEPFDENDQEKTPNGSFRNVREAFDSGREHAREKARAAVPEVKVAISEAMCNLAYRLAFGTTFASTFAQELVPENLKERMENGALAGRDAARKFQGQVREAFKQPTAREEPVDLQDGSPA